jgi:hypothetical protein
MIGNRDGGRGEPNLSQPRIIFSRLSALLRSEQLPIAFSCVNWAVQQNLVCQSEWLQHAAAGQGVALTVPCSAICLPPVTSSASALPAARPFALDQFAIPFDRRTFMKESQTDRGPA